MPGVGTWRADLKVRATLDARIGAIMATLKETEIRQRLMTMPEWSLVGSAIYRKYTFQSFLPAIAFVNRVAEAAEKADHHPDITINYNQVSISLSTHSESGVTEKDFQLAEAIDKIHASGT
jgi:4a-hydroxytetrahydrobiopterin dehydratase